MSDVESTILGSLVCSPRLTDIGRINRINRLYFGLLLKDQATALDLGSAELSGLETGRKEITEDIKSRIHAYWAEKFGDHKPR